jgi:hypothetical protein
MNPVRSVVVLSTLLTLLIVGGVTGVVLLGQKRGAGPDMTEGNRLSYPQFAALVEYDRWGLANADEIDYRHVHDNRFHDQFIRASVSEDELSLIMASFGEKHPELVLVQESESAPQDPMVRRAPSWWPAMEGSQELSTIRFTTREKPVDPQLGSGSVWRFDPNRKELFIWDWVRMGD